MAPSTPNNGPIKPNLTAFSDLLSSLNKVAVEVEDPYLKEKAQSLINELKNPVNNLHTVNQYLSFVTGPLSPSSPLAIALHQWAFMLLCIRFEQLGKEIGSFLKNKIKDPESLRSEVISSKKVRVDPKTTTSLLDSTIAQVDRLKEECQAIGNLPIPRFIPMPPMYDEGHDGALFLKRDENDPNKTWHLQFCFDLKDLGPLEIQAQAQFPSIKLRFTSPSKEVLDLTQAMLPLLKERLQEIGVTTRLSLLRQAPITFKENLKGPIRKESGLDLEV